jgi:acetyl esterase/lipase
MNRDITSLPAVVADERVPYGQDASQFFDLWSPHDQPVRGAAVMIHGGFWRSGYDLSHASHLCAKLAQHGIAAASLEYRRVGNVGGGWRGSYEDVLAGFDAAKCFLPKTERFVVLGHSAGGHLALRLAVDRNAMCGVVALAPVASLAMAYQMNLSNGAVSEFLGGTPDAIPGLYAEACPSLHSSPVRRVLIHGTDDDIVPTSLSREFVEARQNDRPAVRLIEIKTAGHFDMIDPESEAFPTVLQTVTEMMDSTPESGKNG